MRPQLTPTEIEALKKLAAAVAGSDGSSAPTAGAGEEPMVEESPAMRVDDMEEVEDEVSEPSMSPMEMGVGAETYNSRQKEDFEAKRNARKQHMSSAWSRAAESVGKA